MSNKTQMLLLLGGTLTNTIYREPFAIDRTKIEKLISLIDEKAKSQGIECIIFFERP